MFWLSVPAGDGLRPAPLFVGGSWLSGRVGDGQPAAGFVEAPGERPQLLELLRGQQRRGSLIPRSLRGTDGDGEQLRRSQRHHREDEQGHEHFDDRETVLPASRR